MIVIYTKSLVFIGEKVDKQSPMIVFNKLERPSFILTNMEFFFIK